jgi:hypothetical protein
MIESKEYVEEIFCVHREYLANQGIVMCSIGDPSKCDTCEFRKPDKQKVKISWTSTEI